MFARLWMHGLRIPWRLVWGCPDVTLCFPRPRTTLTHLLLLVPTRLSLQGTAKLHYVTVRVFRTLLSKGLCSAETEEGEGEGDGDIDGMKVRVVLYVSFDALRCLCCRVGGNEAHRAAAAFGMI